MSDEAKAGDVGEAKAVGVGEAKAAEALRMAQTQKSEGRERRAAAQRACEVVRLPGTSTQKNGPRLHSL